MIENFELKREETEENLNETTIQAIEEGRRLAADPNSKGYKTVEELIESLEEIE